MADPVTVLESPLDDATVDPPFVVSGYAVDLDAGAGTGVDYVHIYAYPITDDGFADPVFLGVATYGGSRPDVAALYGAQFENSGFTLAAPGFGSARARIVAQAHSTVSDTTDSDVAEEVELAAGAFTVGQAQAGDDTLLAWVELALGTAPNYTTYAWSGIALADPSTYFGGYKDVRVLSFGETSRSLSDWFGQLQGAGDFSVRLSDLPDPVMGECLLRTWMADSNVEGVGNQFLPNRQITIRLIRAADRALGRAPRVVARGVVQKTRTVEGDPFTFEFLCQAPFAARFNANVPARTIETNWFPDASRPQTVADIVALGTDDLYQVNTVDNHGYQPGDRIVISDTTGDFDGAWTIEWVLGATAFAITVAGSPASFTGGDGRVELRDGGGIVGTPEPIVYGDTRRMGKAQCPTLLIDFVGLPGGPAPGSLKWPRFLVAGHAVKSVLRAYERYSDGRIVPRDVFDGVDMLLPGHTNWDAYTGSSDSFIDITGDDGVVRRYTVVYCNNIGAIAGAGGTTGIQGVQASATLSLSGNVVDGDTVTVGGKTYTFRDTPADADEIQVGSDANDSLNNLATALASETAIAVDVTGDEMSVTAVEFGTAGNSIAVGINSAVGSWDTHGTLEGGADETSGPGWDLVLDVEGVESAGDGTGDLLEDPDEVYLDFARNHVFGTYETGARLATPRYTDGTPMIDEASFTAAQAKIAGVYGETVKLARVLREQAFASDLIASLNRSADLESGVTAGGQYRVVFTDPTDEAALAVSDVQDILKDSFALDERTEEAANVIRYQAAARGRDGRLMLAGVSKDQDSIDSYGQRWDLSQDHVLEWVHDREVVLVNVARKLERLSMPPRWATLTLELHADVEIGQILSVTHREGYGASGWTDEKVQVRAVSMRLDDGTLAIGGVWLQQPVQVPKNFTTYPEFTYPDGDIGVAVTPNGSSWANSSWVEIVASTPEAWYLAHLAIKVGANNGLFEVDLGTGTAGNETPIVTLAGRSGAPSFTGFGQYHLAVPYGPVAAGTRLSVRLRMNGTDTTAWRVGLGYYKTLETGASKSLVSPASWPPAGQVSVTLSATPWANSSWVEVIASTAGVLTLSQIALVRSQNVDAFEIDIGVGGAGSEVVATTVAGYATEFFGQGPGVMPLRPMLTIASGARVSVRIRHSQTTTDPFVVKLNGYVAFDRAELVTARPQIHWPSAANLATVTSGAASWVSGAWVELDAALAAETAITGLVFGVGTTGTDMEVDIGIGAAGNEVVVTTFRCSTQGVAETNHFALLHYARTVAAGQRLVARVRANNNATTNVPVKVFGIQSPDFSQTTTAAQAAWPSAAVALIVTEGAADFVYGAWTEFAAATAADSVITGIDITQAWDGDADVQIGFGAAGSEVVATTYRLYGHSNVTSHSDYRLLPVPLFVPAGTRVAMRVRRKVAASQGWRMAMTYMEADGG